MLRRPTPAALLIAASLACAAPVPVTHAQDVPETTTATDETGDTRFGVIMAVSCGGGARLSTAFPNPISISLTLVACVAMVVDALISADQP